MHADANQIDAVTTQMRGKMRLLTLDHIDGRTAAAKRARELIAAIEGDLGGADRLSEGSRQLVQRAAVLGAFIENCEAMWLAGDTVELNDYLAAINSQRRVLQTIGLERHARDVGGMSLFEARRLDLAEQRAEAEATDALEGAEVVDTAAAEERTTGRRRVKVKPSNGEVPA